jgi:hypothetical protein
VTAQSVVGAELRRLQERHRDRRVDQRDLDIDLGRPWHQRERHRARGQAEHQSVARSRGAHADAARRRREGQRREVGIPAQALLGEAGLGPQAGENLPAIGIRVDEDAKAALNDF